MRGEFIGVWTETYREVWRPLIEQPLGENDETLPDDIFCELYRELAKALKVQPSVEELADVIDDATQARRAFESINAADIAGERLLVVFFESVHDMLEDYEISADDSLRNRYFNLLAAFIEKYSLRYDLRHPCLLCPTLPGLFASLVRDLRGLAGADPHLDSLLKEFENAVRDLRQDCSEGRIKTCIQKQVNLIEAIARTYPGVTHKTLGAICDEVDTWPHEKLKAAMKDLYGFASDYPGIRHGGTPAHALRPVDMRDMVAMSILLAGFIPYLNSGFKPEMVFHGS